jgi:tetratricopeptide (TPR) repeat protein
VNIPKLHLPRIAGLAFCAPLAVWAFVASARSNGAAAVETNQNWVEVRSPHFTVASNGSEKDARRVAGQFEQMRAMFHIAFPPFRTDPPQPIYIVAVKNEGTMKSLLPEYWEKKGHLHPDGIYQAGHDKDYVVLRLDSQGSNPYHVVYHEYTHALLHLNFTGLPLWLDEGLAEFFGNTTLGERESQTGTVNAETLQFLQQRQTIPVETLLQVDHSSPYYNESDRASVFYAESWALVHYLMMNPDARQQQLLSKFTAAWDRTQNQVEAARQTFGDLKRFANVIDGYLHQRTFLVGVVKMQQADESKTYAARHLSAGEALTVQGDFLAREKRPEAKAMLDEAVRLDPNLGVAHESMGYWYYRRQELEKADDEMKLAIAHGDNGFAPMYFHGALLAQLARSKETSDEAIASLQKSTELNPQFAPAFDMLAYAYSSSPESLSKALKASVTAAKLSPSTHEYVFHLIHLLISNNQTADARTLAQRVSAGAATPEERSTAESLLSQIAEHEKWMATANEKHAVDARSDRPPTAGGASGGVAFTTSDATKPEAVRAKSMNMAVEGKIEEVTCNVAPEIWMKLNFSGSLLSLHAAQLDPAAITIASGQPPTTIEQCAKWVGRKAKVWVHLNQGQGTFGEIIKIYFY